MAILKLTQPEEILVLWRAERQCRLTVFQLMLEGGEDCLAAAVLHDELLALLIHSDFQVAVVSILMLDIDPVGQVALRFSLCELYTDGILCHITDFQLTTTERLLGKCDNGAAE